MRWVAGILLGAALSTSVVAQSFEERITPYTEALENIIPMTLGCFTEEYKTQEASEECLQNVYAFELLALQALSVEVYKEGYKDCKLEGEK